MSKLKNTIDQFYSNYKNFIGQYDTSSVAEKRDTAFQNFLQQGFPHKKLEDWKKSNIGEYLTKYYHLNFSDSVFNINQEALFECDIPQLDAYKIAIHNGQFYSKFGSLFVLGNGIIVGSLAMAMKKYPELVDKYFHQLASTKDTHIVNINTALFKDGVFIYVPENVQATQIIQFSHGINGKVDSMFNTRNLIILEKNSSLKMIQCDDSNNTTDHFNTFVNEIYLGENSELDYTNYQNINNSSVLLQSTFFQLKDKAKLNSTTFSLNGGLIRNEHHVQLDGEYCDAGIHGLFLGDRDQQIDNQVYMNHDKPNCVSRENFKGILDDHAKGIFHGHILVRKDAQKTQAYQNNANILLTDKAKIDTHPFLEIYADDVSCSHGATVGQLNEEAFFYMQTRGISTKDAKLLQLYAFTTEIINKINHPILIERTEDLVKKRLRGELGYCDKCVLHCKVPEIIEEEI